MFIPLRGANCNRSAATTKKNPIKFPGASGNPFSNLEKTSVLQEARAFNDTSVNPRKCTQILTKILYLINQVS
jgi:hypothetical protein